MHIIQHSGWGTMQEVAMRNATVEDFESTIKGLEIRDFRVFMLRMIEMRIHRLNYDSHFGPATDRFAEACRNIVNAPNSGRLGVLIKDLFNYASIGAELAFQASPVVP
jgi:hypothetical protein